MKSILVIGLGRFGQHLVKKLSEYDNEILAIDRYEENSKLVEEYATYTQFGDCRSEKVLRSLGVGNFDLCFVCVGTEFQSSLEITALLKELGAKYVISKAISDIHAKFLSRNGADEVAYPERDIAVRFATRHSAKILFDYYELNDEYSIYEIPPLHEWVGKSFRDINLRNVYKLNVLATKQDNEILSMPDADHIVCANEHLIVMGNTKDAHKVLKRLD